jgi:hypothetical protein
MQPFWRREPDRAVFDFVSVQQGPRWANHTMGSLAKHAPATFRWIEVVNRVLNNATWRP